MNTNWLKKIGFWGFHIFVWILLNIVLGSLPFFVTLLRVGEDDPMLIGLLCFCFTAASSGLYIFLANSMKGEQSGLAKALYMTLIAGTILWIIGVWTIVLKLPEMLQLVGNANKMNVFLPLYICSILLFFFANYKSLSGLVNNHVSKYLIVDPVKASKISGSAMKASLDREGNF
jgi:hypothetical protein